MNLLPIVALCSSLVGGAIARARIHLGGQVIAAPLILAGSIPVRGMAFPWRGFDQRR